MDWIACNLRGTTVYARASPDGTIAADANGRVDIVYQLGPNAKVYRTAVRNLAPTRDANSTEPVRREVGDAVIIYTDGACTGNPGPCGLGVVIVDEQDRRELSEYLGVGTNNIAELTAILRALQQVRDRQRRVMLHTDSSYSIGVLTKNWKAKKNTELIASLRELVAKFPQLQFVKVKGHSGVPENERADELARRAVSERRRS